MHQDCRMQFNRDRQLVVNEDADVDHRRYWPELGDVLTLFWKSLDIVVKNCSRHRPDRCQLTPLTVQRQTDWVTPRFPSSPAKQMVSSWFHSVTGTDLTGTIRESYLLALFDEYRDRLKRNSGRSRSIPPCLASGRIEQVESYEWSGTYRVRWGHFNYLRCKCAFIWALRKVFHEV